MNRNEAATALRIFSEDDDPARHHQKADDILCLLLRDLGCADIVNLYNQVTRHEKEASARQEVTHSD